MAEVLESLHSKMVKSNIASTLLIIIDKCFPEGSRPKEHLQQEHCEGQLQKND